MASNTSESNFPEASKSSASSSLDSQERKDRVQISCYSDSVQDGLIHFQIIQLQKQVYVWIGFKSAKFGRLYAATSTHLNNLVNVTSLLGGTADSCGSGIARRLVLKTGLNVIVACNLPKDNPMLEASVEVKLMEKLKVLGLVKPLSKHSAHIEEQD